MAKIKLYVTHIFNSGDNGIYGIEDKMSRIEKNLSTIFDPSDIVLLKSKAKENTEGMNYTHSFCQFIVYLTIRQDLKNGQITFFDCNNNMDTALDIYNGFNKNGHTSLQKQDFMNRFLEVGNQYDVVKDAAELTTE